MMTPTPARSAARLLSFSLLALALAACSAADPEAEDSKSGSTGGAPASGGMSGSADTSSGGSDDAGTGDASGGTSSQGTGGAMDGNGGTGTFTLSSPQLMDGGVFADEHTCALAGFNGSLSPELVWTPGPDGTKSYAITFIDVTLASQEPPSDLGYHWVIYDIPANVLSLPEGLTDAGSVGAQQSGAYLGPCPNFGTSGETHTYEFRIYALDTETLPLAQTMGIEAVKEAESKLVADHLAVAVLSGTSDAAP